MLSLTKKVEGLERAEIAEALEKAGWVRARAARMLGITERVIGYKVRKYGIKREVIISREFEAQGSRTSYKEEFAGQEKIPKEER